MGTFITIDGPSGVGKTTVSALLRQLCVDHGIDALLTATPSAGAIGELARNGTYRYQGLCLACLVTADRYDHVQRVVEPAMRDHRTVICDRYVPSALVFDCADGVAAQLVWQIYREIRVPEIAFVLLGEPTACTARATERGRHSRFHAINEDASRVEHERYRAAIDVLRGVGYPVWPYDIGNATASEVARVLVNEVLERAV